MKPETMMIDDVKYVRADSVENCKIDEKSEPLRIIMTDDRGLCLVGNVDLSGDHEFVEVKNARCVIRWGTTGHIAELAKKGPMENTRFGTVCTQFVARAKIMLFINCNAEAWQ